jgi:hypothetical protein
MPAVIAPASRKLSWRSGTFSLGNRSDRLRSKRGFGSHDAQAKFYTQAILEIMTCVK